MIEQEYSAGAAAVRRAESADIDALGPAMNRVQPRVARSAKDFLWLYDFDNLRLSRIRLGVEDVDAGRAQPGNDQVAALYVRMRSIGAQSRTACVPTEVMQLVAGLGHLDLAYNFSKSR